MDNENLVSDMLYEANRTTSALECYPLGSEPDWEDYGCLYQVRNAISKNFNQKFQYLSFIPGYGEALKTALEGESKGRGLLLKRYREFIIEDLIKNHVKNNEHTIFGIKGKKVYLSLPTGGSSKYFVVDKIPYYGESDYSNGGKKIEIFHFNLSNEDFNRLENGVYTKEELLQIYKSILNYMNAHGAEFRFSLETIEDLKQEDEEIKEFCSLIRKIIPIPDFSNYGCGDEITPKCVSNVLGSNGAPIEILGDGPGFFTTVGGYTSRSGTILLNFDKIGTLS